MTAKSGSCRRPALHISASGSMTGSATSLANWLRALLAEPVSLAACSRRLSAPRNLADGRESGYGLGMRRTILGGRHFTGHGGSHPGYKTYFLLDPQTKCGFVIVSNREDTNGNKIAQEAMAALLDLPLPRPVSGHNRWPLRHGNRTLVDRGQGSTVTYLDADDTVYEDDGVLVSSSRPSSSPMLLKMDGDGIVGEIGHAGGGSLPARNDGVSASLDRVLAIAGGRVL
jgi:CubicO group peptidase (beta-lactamase class C family)